jgi:hypothetical protein
LGGCGQGGEHDDQVGFDGAALVVIDGPGLQIVLERPEGLHLPHAAGGCAPPHDLTSLDVGDRGN